MQYGLFNINQAQGVILCNDMALGEKFYPKGHSLTAEDIIIFKMHDLRKIYGAIFEEGDIEYATALHQIAAQICGAGLGYIVSDDGICKITSLIDGIFIVDDKRINKFNSINSDVILNTIQPHQLIKSGDIVAELEITGPLIKDSDIQDIIFRLSGNGSLLSVSEIRELKSILVYPHLLNDENENKHLTSVVMKLVTELDGLGLVFDREISSNYDKESLTDSIFDAFALNADVVFVINPLKSFGENDVVSLAVKSAADDIFSYSIPQVGASDLLIAQKGTSKIIVLPCYYDQKDSNISNQIIKHAIYTEHLTAAEFNYKPSPNIEANFIDEDNLSKVISPSNRKTKAEKASIGAVILAAGQGRRSGTNKLLVEDQNNIPMFMHAINSAIASDAKPVFVVTGYRHEEMEEYLEKIDVNVLYNPSYASGIKTSINMGLRAIPSSCDGAILLPADMPYISAADINKLINKFDKNFEKQVCMYSNKGVKSNPILWSKSLYEKADIVPDNAMTRVVFVEHADYTKTIETKDKKKLLDINYPNDVEEFSKQ